MEIVIIVVVIVLCIVVLAASPMTKRQGDSAESLHRHDSERQFRRPPNEGDLL
jgi:hypothetical protein